MHQFIKYIIALALLLLGLGGFAQENICFSPRIRTLQVKMNGQWDAPPVMLLSKGQYVEISFDDLQAQYERYTYTITHCNADWTPSDLLTSEYMTGFAEQRIEDYEPAMSTELKY